MLPQIQRKYQQSFCFYFAKPINEILSSCSLSHVVRYQEIQYQINHTEFLKMYYSKKSKRLSLLITFYTKHSKPPKPNLACHQQVRIVDNRHSLLSKLKRKQKHNHKQLHTNQSSVFDIYSQHSPRPKPMQIQLKLNLLQKVLDESQEDPLYDYNPSLAKSLKKQFDSITTLENKRMQKFIKLKSHNFQIIPRKKIPIYDDYMTDRRIQTSNTYRLSNPNTNRSSQSKQSRLESLIKKTKSYDSNRKQLIKLNLEKIMKKVNSKQFS